MRAASPARRPAAAACSRTGQTAAIIRTALLLGSVVIQTNVQQVVPSYTAVKGYATLSLTGLGGTIIQATTSFPSSTAVVEYGGVNPSYAVKISHISVDSRGIWHQHGVDGWHWHRKSVRRGKFLPRQYPNKWVPHWHLCPWHRASQSGPYSDLTMNDQDIAATPDTSFKCLQIGDCLIRRYSVVQLQQNQLRRWRWRRNAGCSDRD